MSKYLDKEGYRRKDVPGESRRDILALEREIKLRMKRGATLAEAVYEIISTLQTAATNCRITAVMEGMKKKGKRAKAVRNASGLVSPCVD